MGFCLNCHRAPAQFVREPKDVFNLDSPRLVEAQGEKAAANFVHDWKINPPQNCSGCHR
jgi:hypothetical protein